MDFCMKRKSLVENKTLKLFSIEEMENICYDAFVIISEILDNKSLFYLCSTTSLLYQYGQ